MQLYNCSGFQVVLIVKSLLQLVLCMCLCVNVYLHALLQYYLNVRNVIIALAINSTRAWNWPRSDVPQSLQPVLERRISSFFVTWDGYLISATTKFVWLNIVLKIRISTSWWGYSFNFNYLRIWSFPMYVLVITLQECYFLNCC